MDVCESYLLRWRSSHSLIQSINFTARVSLGAQTLLVLPPPAPPPSLELFGCILPGEGWEHRYLGIVAGPGWSDSHKRKKGSSLLEVGSLSHEKESLRGEVGDLAAWGQTTNSTHYNLPPPHASSCGNSMPHCHHFFKVLTGDRSCEINHSHWCDS